MVRSFWVLGALALTAVGCSGDKSTGEDDTSTDECTTTIKDTYPSSDQADFYYRGDLEVTFSEPDSTAAVTLTDSAGGAVSGTTWWSDDSKVLYFTPDGGLNPAADYSLAIDYCGGNPTINFRTSSLGTPVSPSSTLDGKAFVIDLGSARFVEPAGIGSVLGGLLEQNILVGVTSATDAKLTMIGAISEGTTEAQDYCNPTIDFPEADFSGNPFFQIGPKTTTISAAGIDVEIQDLEVSGAFSSDGSYFGGGTLGGTVNTAPLVPLLADDPETAGDDYICNLVSDLGYATCTECPGGEGPYCLTLVVDQIVANGTSTGLEEVEQTDCHELCASNSSDCTL